MRGAWCAYLKISKTNKHKEFDLRPAIAYYSTRMPQVTQLPKKKPRWRNATIVLLLGVIVVGGVGWYIQWRLFPTPSASIDKSITLTNQHDFAGAYRVLDDAYARAIFPADKKSLALNLASSAANEGDLKLSLTYYQKVNAQYPDEYNILTNMAATEARLGYYGDAISHYQAALGLISSGKFIPPAPGTKNYLNSQISYLETKK